MSRLYSGVSAMDPRIREDDIGGVWIATPPEADRNDEMGWGVYWAKNEARLFMG